MKPTEALELLMKNCPELFQQGKAIIFQHFLCPISIIEADVKEYVIDEYDSVELLVLRLYEAGLTEPEKISLLTGIDVGMIDKLLFSEKYTYGHINPDTGEITNAGHVTLKENENIENLFQHALYNVKRELQVDSLTGTLVRAEAEVPKTKMVSYSDKINPNILPKDAVEIDDELNKEICERLQFYIDEGYFSEGNTIEEIGDMHTKEIKYRDAYFTYIDGYEYPFITILYSKRKELGFEKIAMPIAISETDFKYLDKNKDECKYLVRADENFEYLYENEYKFADCPEIDENLLKRILLDEDDDDEADTMDVDDE